MHSEFKDVKYRLSSLELAMSGVKRDQAESLGDYARQQISIDNLVERIQRIEQRLELSECVDHCSVDPWAGPCGGIRNREATGSAWRTYCEAVVRSHGPLRTLPSR